MRLIEFRWGPGSALIHSQHVMLGGIHQLGQLGHIGAELVGDAAPLGVGGGRVGLGESGSDPCGDQAALGLAGMRCGIAHEVDAAALPGRPQDPGHGGLQPLMGVGDDQLDATQATARERAEEVEPEGLGLGGAVAMPRTSRRPSPLTPTAMVTATGMMRPAWRTFT